MGTSTGWWFGTNFCPDRGPKNSVPKNTCGRAHTEVIRKVVGGKTPPPKRARPGLVRSSLISSVLLSGTRNGCDKHADSKHMLGMFPVIANILNMPGTCGLHPPCNRVPAIIPNLVADLPVLRSWGTRGYPVHSSPGVRCNQDFRIAAVDI